MVIDVSKLKWPPAFYDLMTHDTSNVSTKHSRQH